MPYIANTEKDREEMLKCIGVNSFEELIVDIPKESLIPDNERLLEDGKSELEITKLGTTLAAKNLNTTEYTSYLGAGSYDHYIPTIVDYIVSRPEFQTAYTPYQAEISQGTLQSIYEYQTMICRLTGMYVTNASMYDGATALAEAVVLANGVSKKNRILISSAVHPNFLEVLKTSIGDSTKIDFVDAENGVTAYDKYATLFNDETSAIIIQTPNFYGNIEDVTKLADLAHSKKALFIMIVDPISLGMLKKPSEYGADIVVAEGQSLGIHQSFGGPYLGIFAVTKDLIRKMPGRIVGLTEDVDGKRAFVLTLQTREQHIRRDKATSNICSNQALMALSASVYMTTMGKEGISEVARQSYLKSHFLANELSKIAGIKVKYDAPFFKEFVITTPMEAKKIIDEAKKYKIFAGLSMNKFGGNSNEMLVAVTEKRTKEELLFYVETIKTILSQIK